MSVLRNLRHWLSDFSAGQEEGKRMERLFRVALAETTSDAEFRALCYHMTRADDHLTKQVRWRNVMGQLDQFLAASELDWRVAAKRLIDYLPRCYGYKSDWDASCERSQV